MEYPNTASNDESPSTRSHCNADGFIDDIKVCQVCSMKGNEIVFLSLHVSYLFLGHLHYHMV